MLPYALVTGADRGLGYALVKQLLHRQYNVIASQYMRDQGQLDQLANEYEGKLTLVQLDVANDHSVAQAAKTIATLTDKLDILINNAGVLGDTEATIHEPLNFNEMQQVFNVNSLGPLRVVNALAPLVLASDRKLIVNISSEAGSIAECERTSWFGYCMSKAALNMQSALIHNQIKSAGGQLLLLHPGWVQSYMHGSLNLEADLSADESASQIVNRIFEFKATPTNKPIYMDYLGNLLPW
ncbi:MAG: SDR family oxidoreductase [Candidatus Cohnella colombiensis]|uniref:SDR family oxidoreductase n=1 Tax=Candidatus Cohnella colombiensis TaxID=3121368 RepID=A0AA95EUY3_9BACL|nr:MAG: SDR family oxidoreductase [Cohnella sp.]